ncbi:MAG: transposase [Chlamydiae bacterium]|nr:transposase [Chlamydiota bacterium]
MRFFLAVNNPLRNAADTTSDHIDYKLIYFWYMITNTTSEGLNSKIQKIKAMACRFRNRENFRIAIYFHFGCLELFP